ncbi:MAG: hypothetical protein Kow0020_04410 [Wenzhouxiangellaceae bacterium]
MKSTHTHHNLKTRLAGVGLLAAGALLASNVALGCTTANWTATSGAVAAGSPSPDGIARYQGLCALQATGTGYVQDNSPGGIDRIVARFYVLNNNTSTATIYQGYGNTSGGNARFTVTLDNAGNVTLTDEATGQFVTQSGSTNWLSVEIDWGQGAGTGFASLSVNGATAAQATGLSNSGTALQSVRLGNLNGATGTLNFDSYESRRSTAIGRLLVADANGNGSINALDMVALRNEILGNALATGTPDCNENGGINSQDIVCTRNIILGP